MTGETIFKMISSLFKSHHDGLVILGALAVVYAALKIAFSLWSVIKLYLLAPTLNLGADLKYFGPWAVVTGATDGIGRAYAEKLGKLGLKIVLISRSSEKLANIAKEIENQSHVETKCIAIDFTSGGDGDLSDIYDTIAEELKGLDIGVLVNNVGMSIDFPLFLAECSKQVLKNIITVNCNSVTFMTKMVLTGMVEKKKGLIINISSQSGCKPTPLLSVYSATKAFVEFFSESIAVEYKSKGIIIQCVAPGFVATKMSKIRNPSFFAPSPESFVESALSTVGLTEHSDGCLAHVFQRYVVDHLPNWLYYKVTMSVLGSARARGLKKQKTQ